MKKLSLLILSCILIQSSVSARSVVFKNDDGEFGLKDEQGNITVEAQYKKLIRISHFGQDFVAYVYFGRCEYDAHV